MAIQQQRGIEGENLAANYLAKKGFEVLERNYRYKHAEIDIIAKHNDTIVFVEVKSRSSKSFGYPEEAIDNAKAQHVVRVAEYYILRNNWEGPIRFDIISILLGKKPDLKHFEDAFY